MWYACLSPVWVVSEGTAQRRLPSSEERLRPAPRWESLVVVEGLLSLGQGRRESRNPEPRPGWGDTQVTG